MKRLLAALCAFLLIFTPTLAEDGDASAIFSRELTQGDLGADVKALQTRLAQLEYYNGQISGSYMEGTATAVRAFQADYGMPTTGTLDQATQALLLSAQYRPLVLGRQGEDVERLQLRLTQLGFYTGTITGNYLKSTQEAVSAFQTHNGLAADGTASPELQSLLFGGKALSVHETALATPEPAGVNFTVDETNAEDDGTVPYTKKLQRGSEGTLVKQAQERLMALGYFAGPANGHFRNKTYAAVQAFQKQHSIAADGVIGEQTWNLLFNDPEPVLPDETPRPAPEAAPAPFHIIVDVTNQVVTVYARSESGEYDMVVREMICSTGTRAAPSDVGDWVLTGRKASWCYFPTWGGHARYWTRINASIAFHSVIYDTPDMMDLSIKSYKNLGSRASHGCIRLLVADAKWIYDNVGEGTVVTITESLPTDQELVDSLEVPPLNYDNMLPKSTPYPTAAPVYVSGGLPPMPLEKLQRGDEGEAVYWLQRKLTELGYYTGKCSGAYLNGTKAAVKAFQQDAGLKADGIAGVQTLEALYAQELSVPTLPPMLVEEPTETPAPPAATPAPQG